MNDIDAASSRRSSVRARCLHRLASVVACLGFFVACSDGDKSADPESSSDATGGHAEGSGSKGSGGSGGASGSAGNRVSSTKTEAGGAGTGTGTAGQSKNSGGSSGGTVGTGGKGTGPTGVGGRSGLGGTSVDGGQPQGSGGTTVAKADGGKSDGGKSDGSVAAGGSQLGGSTGTGGTPVGDGGGGTFAPCPASGACQLLPLGDSITVGLQSSGGGYRVELFTRAVQDNRNITFTGTQTPNGPDTVAGKPFPKNHEGISGQTIDQIASRVPKPAFNTIPNIVLLMAGTNDVYASSGQSTMPDRLGTLIDKCVSAAPDALIAVATLTPLSNTSWQTTLETYNQQIPGVVKKRADAGKHVIVVDMSKVSSSMLSDGVHPNDQGYKAMGDTWYEAIKAYLPAQ